MPLQCLLKAGEMRPKAINAYIHTIKYGLIDDAINKADSIGNKVKEMHYTRQD